MYEEVNNTAISISDNKIIQSIDSIKTYAYKCKKKNAKKNKLKG